MSKFTYLLAAILVIFGCAKPSETFKGKEYQLLQSQNDAKITLAFDATENRFFGKVVNNYFGHYQVDGHKIKFGPAASTMMMGPEDQMEAEYNYLQILPRIESYKFSGSTLILITNNGQELAFKYLGPVKAETNQE